MNEKMIGSIVKNKRLNMNISMEELANKVGISRATLWAIEKGEKNYSFSSLLNVMNELDLLVAVNNNVEPAKKARASRYATAREKRINRFVIMCIEQYASHINKNSKESYVLLENNNILSELENDYEDLHGMSTEWLNDYLDKRIENGTHTR